MVSKTILILFIILPSKFIEGLTDFLKKNAMENQKMEFITQVIIQNFEINAWNIILAVGHFPDEFYQKLSDHHVVNTDIQKADYSITNIVPYSSNSIIIKCSTYTDFEKALNKLIKYPYWHPHSNIIIYFTRNISKLTIALTFYSLWYFKGCNAIIISFDDSRSAALISYYTPFTHEHYKLDHEFGCWRIKKTGTPLRNVVNAFICEPHCNNVTLLSKRRFDNLGTCMSFSTHEIKIEDIDRVKKLNLFEDKGRNLHGYPMRSYASEHVHFATIKDNGNGTYTLGELNGHIWNLMSKLHNFTINLSPNEKYMKKKFDYQNAISHMTNFAYGKIELCLTPVYLMDVMVFEVEMTYPYKESGVCFVSRKADFKTVLFDFNILLRNNTILIIKITFCYIALWLGFFLFSVAETGQPSFDRAGKDLLNAIRNILSITIYKPPKNRVIRLLLFVSIWGFFIINFLTQAVITSFFTTFKRGKEIDTFEDILSTKNLLYGLVSPDVLLPDTEKKFIEINSRMRHSPDIIECADLLMNSTDRFCLVECAIAKYLEVNKLDDKGNQYLHVASERVHSRYLNMMLQKNYPMVPQFNKYMATFTEAGLIKKWEEYKYNDFKEDVPFKVLRIGDLIGIFELYGVMVGLSCIVFVMENILHLYYWIKLKMYRFLDTRLRRRVISTPASLE